MSETSVKNERVVVLFSGGIDSSTLLYLARDQGLEPVAFSINYGQRHGKELDFAAKHCTKLEVEHIVVDAGALAEAFASSALLDKNAELPSGEYDKASLAATVVPNRNMVMLAIAAAAGITRGITRLWYGAHQNDTITYPDCRPAFVAAMQQAFALCNEPGVRLEVPFAEITKAQVVAEGARLGVDFALCWSCYQGGEKQCGKCSTCRDRAGAFAANSLADPLAS